MQSQAEKEAGRRIRHNIILFAHATTTTTTSVLLLLLRSANVRTNSSVGLMSEE